MATKTKCMKCGAYTSVIAGQSPAAAKCMMCSVDETTGNVTYIKGL